MKNIILIIATVLPLSLLSQAVAINTDGSLPDNNAILDIKSNSKGIIIPRLTTLQRNSIAGPAIGLTVYDIDTYNYWMYRGDVNGGWVELMNSLDKHWNRTGTHVFNNNSGNIGIGISNPVSRFHIGTGNDASATLHGYLMMGSQNGENLVLDNNEILARNNGVVSTLFLARDGSKVQLGNGTEGTGTKLHITSGNDVGLPNNLSGFLMMGTQTGSNMVLDNNEIQVRNNGAGTHLYLQNGGGNVFIGDATNFNNAHRLGVDGNAVFTGNVRIGTTATPSGYRLAVDGKMICTELLVRLVSNWPDYVFNKNYKLPGLHEVEDFISKYNHLPGIPSAKELEKNGLNIGEMQKLQMEKIEELTIYIIELKKEIEKLSAECTGKKQH